MKRFLLAPLLAFSLAAPLRAAELPVAPAENQNLEASLHESLALLPEPTGEGSEPLPQVLEGQIEASQPRSGDSLLAIIADKKSPLHRRAVNAFVSAWKSMSGEQMARYFRLQLEPVPHLRPRYPAGFDASGRILYRFGYGWGGLASGFPFRVRATHFLDGKPLGEPRSAEVQWPEAALGFVKTGGLALGAHTTSMTLEFEFERDGATQRGELRSPDFGFEIVDSDAPDDLEVVEDEASRARLQEALVPQSTSGAALGGFSQSQGQYGLVVPRWALNDSLPFALCFDVEFHVGDKVFAGSPLQLPAGRGYTGAFSLEDINGFIAGRAGRVPVKIVLRPSHGLALSDSEVRSFYGSTIELDGLYVDITRPPGWAAPVNPLNRP